MPADAFRTLLWADLARTRAFATRPPSYDIATHWCLPDRQTPACASAYPFHSQRRAAPRRAAMPLQRREGHLTALALALALALNAGRNPRAAMPSCQPGTQTPAWRLKGAPPLLLRATKFLRAEVVAHTSCGIATVWTRRLSPGPYRQKRRLRSVEFTP